MAPASSLCGDTRRISRRNFTKSIEGGAFSSTPVAMVGARRTQRLTQFVPGPALLYPLPALGKNWKAVPSGREHLRSETWPPASTTSAICGPGCAGGDDRCSVPCRNSARTSKVDLNWMMTRENDSIHISPDLGLRLL